ncbi:MAG: hypothetical protein Q8943_17205 [Bacteroidota bacterium]|nr:hypothetical protein [Bacteroidota bacterium]
MKPLFRVRPWACLVAFSILAASCSKRTPSSSEDQGICVSRIFPQVSDHAVSGANLDSIYRLFALNNLSTADLQFQSWQTYTTNNVNAGAYSGYQEQVQAVQFFNGLPVFNETEYFTFDAGSYQPGGMNDGYTGPVPAADTTGHQTPGGLRAAFLQKLSQSYIAGGPLHSRPFVPSPSTYVNACLDVSLGYLDAGLIPGNAAGFESALVKVWRVTPTRSSSITYYPLVFVEDDNGFAWGVPSFHP